MEPPGLASSAQGCGVGFKRDVVGDLARLGFLFRGTDGPTQDSGTTGFEFGDAGIRQIGRPMRNEARLSPVVIRNPAQAGAEIGRDGRAQFRVEILGGQTPWNLRGQPGDFGNAVRVERHDRDWPAVGFQRVGGGLFKPPVGCHHGVEAIFDFDQHRDTARNDGKYLGKGRDLVIAVKKPDQTEFGRRMIHDGPGHARHPVKFVVMKNHGLPIRTELHVKLDSIACLDGSALGLHIEVQKVAHESRVHLDIEADDVNAEATRLEALGAKKIAFVRERWWVMEAPTGQRFCVVRMKHPERGASAKTWG